VPSVAASVVIIGGGPAGAVAGQLLAEWGHKTIILEQRAERAADARGLAESIPPSARKLFKQIGILDDVEAAGFYRSSGNTVWWGGDDCRVESFDGGHRTGWQVFRPSFDRWLAELAVRRGVEVRGGARVREVQDAGGMARVEFDCDGVRDTLHCDWVLDCSGRAGVLARRVRRPGVRTFSLVGAWRTSVGWNVPDPTHTLVEAYDRGWAWSIPRADTLRQVGVMLDGPSPRRDGTHALVDAYRSELDRTAHMARHVADAELDGVWACDASTYSSVECSGRRHLLVGDAASFVDPLSSFGVKKAMGSAWMAAVVVNTILRHGERRGAAVELFESWERDVSATHLAKTQDFARAAGAHFDHRFWTTRANAALAAPGGRTSDQASDAALRAAFRDIQDSEELDFDLDDRVTFERLPVIRDREVVLEDAFPSGMRFRDNVDLVTLARLACRHRHVPDLFEAYCRAHAPVPLPNVLGGLSLLVAKGYLIKKDGVRC
jgi:flavin-dependent dehydrogenase